MSDSGIYQIRNTVNGKRYIGSAVNINRRFRDHKSDLNRFVHINKHLQSAWNKYGASAFIFEVLELCPRELLYKVEQDFLDDYTPEYNENKLASGANAWQGKHRSDETKAKLSASQIGKKLTDEHKRNISLGHKGQVPWIKGKKHSILSRLKISLASMGRSPGNKGKTPSQETKDKMSIAQTARRLREGK